MIGRIDPEIKKVHVVGGGVSGLLAAYHLDLCGYEVTLTEKSSHLGGLLATRKLKYGLAEAAAHSLLGTQPVLDLLTDLEVPWTEVQPESKARFILRDGKLRRFPLKFFEVLSLLFRVYFLRAIRGRAGALLSLRDWGLRHLGKGATDYLLDPFVTGIYGSTPQELIVGGAFPSLVVSPGNSLVSQWIGRKLRPDHYRLNFPALPPLDRATTRRRHRGRPKMIAPLDGMGGLIQALESKVRARLGTRVRTGVAITEEDLEASDCNWVFTLPAPDLSAALRKKDPTSSTVLARVPYAPLVSVTVLCQREAFPIAPQGVGLLIPSKEDKKILGVLFNSSSFEGRVTEPEQVVSLTVILGGTRNPEALMCSDEEILGWIEEGLNETLGLRQGGILESQIHRWSHAIPQYGATLMEAWTTLKHGWCQEPGRVVFGNHSGQISLRGMIESLPLLARRSN